jgi:hypothetical protein
MTTQLRRRPSTARMLIVTGLLAIGVTPTAAADRPNDKDVKDLMVRVDEERDRFEDQLDGKLKHSIIRGPGGEVNVGQFLDDLQANVDKMKDRFTSEYAASAEVTTVLRQGTDIQRYMSTLPPNFDGASEWNKLASSLVELAGVYGTTLPLSEGHQARRLNDTEVKKAAEALAKSADSFKKELDASLKKDKTVDKATREAAVKEAAGLKDDARKLGSLVGDGRPASGEAQALLQRAGTVKAAMSGRTLSPAAQSAWGTFESGLGKVAQAFNMPAQLP